MKLEQKNNTLFNSEYQYSVLMSVYIKDSACYLKDAIESMLNQTLKPEQFVIIKDGPVDNDVQNIIDEYQMNYEELFTVITIEENKGLANALNIGLKACRNELVARMDADDVSLPRRCEKEMECFNKNKDLVICGCNINEFEHDINDIHLTRVVPEKYEDIVRFMRRRQAFNHPTVMYKKEKVIEVGGYCELRRKEDFDLFSRMLMKGCYAENINESLYLYRANEGSYTRRKSWTNLKSAIYVYWLHFRRKGCGLFDFLLICFGEVTFVLLPNKLMKLVSDKVLRKPYHV